MRFFEKQSNMKMELMKIINPKLARGHKELIGMTVGGLTGATAGIGHLKIDNEFARDVTSKVLEHAAPGYRERQLAALADVDKYYLDVPIALGGAALGGYAGKQIGKHLANKAEKTYQIKRLIAGAGLATAGARALALSKKD